MSLATKITTTDTATPWLRDLASRVSPHRICAEAGPRCTRLMKRNFLKQGTNKNGWPSTNFWARAAEATNWQEGNGFVMIGANQIGIRQRYYGGPIAPVNAGALTIPASPEAYGKTAGEFGDLKFAFVLDPALGKMRPALVEKKGTEHKRFGRKKKDGTRTETVTSVSTGLVALFWLAKSVNQKPDPGVIPSDEEFLAALDESIEALLRFSN